jgi:hypothetical protein
MSRQVNTLFLKNVIAFYVDIFPVVEKMGLIIRIYGDISQRSLSKKIF